MASFNRCHFCVCMKTFSLNCCFGLALSLLAISFHQLQATDLAVSGNLSVSGEVDILGGITTIGSWAGDPSHPGITIQYGEVSGVSTISSNASRNTNTWFWTHNSASGLIKSMQLDPSHRLVLFGSNGTTAGITLDPAGASTIAGSLLVNGASITMPNQVLSGTSSALTQGLGDARYMLKNATNWAIGTGATITGANSLAFGANAQSTSIDSPRGASIAIGRNAFAQTGTSTWTGYGNISGSVAIGDGAIAGDGAGMGGGVAIGALSYCRDSGGSAIGYGSISTAAYASAMSFNARAYGVGSLALGTSTTAGAPWATSVGNNIETTGNYATALGNNLTVAGFGETVIGRYNALEPGVNAWTQSATANCFVVANGSSTTQRSNAMVILWNGDATHNGNVIVTKKLTATQGAKFDDTVRIAPRGGLSMGEFTYDPNAVPGA
jgi:hypothetical protein